MKQRDFTKDKEEKTNKMRRKARNDEGRKRGGTKNLNSMENEIKGVEVK